MKLKKLIKLISSRTFFLVLGILIAIGIYSVQAVFDPVDSKVVPGATVSSASWNDLVDQINRNTNNFDLVPGQAPQTLLTDILNASSLDTSLFSVSDCKFLVSTNWSTVNTWAVGWGPQGATGGAGYVDNDRIRCGVGDAGALNEHAAATCDVLIICR